MKWTTHKELKESALTSHDLPDQESPEFITQEEFRSYQGRIDQTLDELLKSIADVRHEVDKVDIKAKVHDIRITNVAYAIDLERERINAQVAVVSDLERRILDRDEQVIKAICEIEQRDSV
jgi:hypothetical protein